MQAFAAAAAAYRLGRGINGHPEVILEIMKRASTDQGDGQATCAALLAWHVLSWVWCPRKRYVAGVMGSCHRVPLRTQARTSPGAREVGARARKRVASAGGGRPQARKKPQKASRAKRGESSARPKGRARARK